MFSICYMDKSRRGLALSHLLLSKFKGDRKRLMTQAKVSKGLVAQYLSAGFGERAARNLEQKLRLPKDWFEQDYDGVLTPEQTMQPTKEPYIPPEEIAMDLQRQAAEVARAWLTLNERDRMDFKQQIEAKALQNRAFVPDQKLTHLAAPKPAKRDVSTQ